MHGFIETGRYSGIYEPDRGFVVDDIDFTEVRKMVLTLVEYVFTGGLSDSQTGETVSSAHLEFLVIPGTPIPLYVLGQEDHVKYGHVNLVNDRSDQITLAWTLDWSGWDYTHIRMGSKTALFTSNGMISPRAFKVQHQTGQAFVRNPKEAHEGEVVAVTVHDSLPVYDNEYTGQSIQFGVALLDCTAQILSQPRVFHGFVVVDHMPLS